MAGSILAARRAGKKAPKMQKLTEKPSAEAMSHQGNVKYVLGLYGKSGM